MKDISSGEKSNIKVDDMVRVNAKVVYKSEVESVFLSKLNKNLMKCDISIVDLPMQCVLYCGKKQ